MSDQYTAPDAFGAHDRDVQWADDRMQTINPDGTPTDINEIIAEDNAIEAWRQTRIERLRAVADEFDASNVDDLDYDGDDRFVLVEQRVTGGYYYLTTVDSADDAGQAAYSLLWDPEFLIDLDTGDRYRGQRTTTFHKIGD